MKSQYFKKPQLRSSHLEFVPLLLRSPTRCLSFAGGILGAPHECELVQVAAEPRTTANPGAQVALLQKQKPLVRCAARAAASTAHSASAFENLTRPRIQRQVAMDKGAEARPGKVLPEGLQEDACVERAASCVSAGSVLLALKILGLRGRGWASWLTMLPKPVVAQVISTAARITLASRGGGRLEASTSMPLSTRRAEPTAAGRPRLVFTTSNSTKEGRQDLAKEPGAHELWPHRPKWNPTFEASQPEAY